MNIFKLLFILTFSIPNLCFSETLFSIPLKSTNDLDMVFEIQRFDGILFSAFEITNSSNKVIKNYYTKVPKVALGINGNKNRDIKPNQLRTFSWGPIVRIQHDLLPGQATGTGVQILRKKPKVYPDGGILDGFAVLKLGVYSFELYFVDGGDYHLTARIYVEFDARLNPRKLWTREI